jgi:hypothetical protein
MLVRIMPNRGEVYASEGDIETAVFTGELIYG